jgi:hypothetical protein
MKRLATLIIFFLLITSTYPSAASQVGNGFPCTKAKSTSNVSGVKYVCVKAKGKLIWKINSEKPLTPKLFEVFVDQFNFTSKTPDLIDKVKIVSSPNISKENLALIENYTNAATTFFSKYFILDRTLTIYLLYKDDGNFFQSVLRDQTLDFQQVWPMLFSAGRSTAFIDSEGRARMLLLINKESPTKGYWLTGNWDLRYLIFHEMTHVFQSLYVGYYGMQDLTPCWYGEGLAEVFGWANSSEEVVSAKSSYEGRGNLFSAWNRLFPELNNTSIEYIGKKLVDCNSYSGINEKLRYNLGMIVMERFILDFGIDGLVKFTSLMGDKPHSEVFLNLFGIDESEWLTKSVAPYVQKFLTWNEETIVLNQERDLLKKFNFNYPKMLPIKKTYSR